MTSNLWEPAVPCNGNLWFPRWQQWLPTFGNRQFLAMNQTQTFRYRSIKQNHKIVKKLFSYHFDMHLFRAKKNAGPAAERTHSATGPLSKTKGSVTGSANKTKQH